jgi:hypothetical protein
MYSTITAIDFPTRYYKPMVRRLGEAAKGSCSISL